MKRSIAAILLSTAASFGFAPAAHAQDEGTKSSEEKKTPDDKKPQDPPRPNRRQQWGAIPVDQLKERLALTDDQVKKLEDMNQEIRDAMRKAAEDPNFDWRKAGQNWQADRDKLRDRIRGILTDEQKPKFEEYVKQEDARMQQGGGFRRSPEEQKKRLHDRAEKELSLSSEEKAAVMPLVDKVLDVRAEARVNEDKRREEFTNFVKKAPAGTDDEKSAIAKKLEEFRKAKEADRQRVKEAQAALREVLTIKDEASLVAIGVLDE